MKRCLQCQTAYPDETQYCLKDGAVLAEEAMSNDDYEEETIIRHEPIIVDFGAEQPPTEQFNYQAAPRPTIIVEKQRNAGKYLLFLIAGLLMGGGLVLVGIFIARNFNQNNNAANVKPNENQSVKISVSNQNANSQTNVSGASNNTNTFESNTIHDERTSADDNDFNGRVITLNAYVRAAPSKTASQIAILPKDDRLKIGMRESPNSPWYQVVCEHGTSGWMHGDTIEFTK
ncbi:MAG: SH3 domain-containing protein [Acidobacteriota bacterium]|nr:SH3 domain-containing protein [Acidobacteriota bacterium]